MTDRPDNLILSGVVGSRSHNTATPVSDYDVMGVFVKDTRDVLGIQGNTAAGSVVRSDKGLFYEIGGFMLRVLEGNPTLAEVLFLDSYDSLSAEGLSLLELRPRLFSRRSVLLGYIDAAERHAGAITSGRFSSRSEKHAYHILRMLKQGESLLASGFFVMDTSQDLEYLREQAKVSQKNPPLFLEHVKDACFKARNMDSCLPQEVDRDEISRWLVSLRLSLLA